MNFNVTTRSVRDRYTLLVKMCKKYGVRKRKGVVSTHLIQWFDETDSERKRESEEKNAKQEEDLIKTQ